MSIADERQTTLEGEVRAIRDVYRENGVSEIVTLFAEDFDFLKKREQINSLGCLKADDIKVSRGQRKKRARKRRPKESLF